MIGNIDYCTSVCNNCTDMYGLIRELEAAHAVAAKREGLSQEQENEIEQLEQDLVDIKSDLDDYRSHLARQISEDAFDEEEIKNLPDDTARVTSDWKHKILECYFRENMLKYFGKRGICMIGFMLMWNSTDPEEKARGVSTACRDSRMWYCCILPFVPLLMILLHSFIFYAADQGGSICHAADG